MADTRGWSQIIENAARISAVIATVVGLTVAARIDQQQVRQADLSIFSDSVDRLIELRNGKNSKERKQRQCAPGYLAALRVATNTAQKVCTYSPREAYGYRQIVHGFLPDAGLCDVDFSGDSASRLRSDFFGSPEQEKLRQDLSVCCPGSRSGVSTLFSGLNLQICDDEYRDSLRAEQDKNRASRRAEQGKSLAEEPPADNSVNNASPPDDPLCEGRVHPRESEGGSAQDYPECWYAMVASLYHGNLKEAAYSVNDVSKKLEKIQGGEHCRQPGVSDQARSELCDANVYVYRRDGIGRFGVVIAQEPTVLASARALRDIARSSIQVSDSEESEGVQISADSFIQNIQSGWYYCGKYDVDSKEKEIIQDLSRCLEY